jgi:hypothetical protein
MADTILTSKLDFNRAAYGDGSGNMANVRTTNASASPTLDVDTTINFRGGEIVDVVQANGTVAGAAIEIGSVDRANRRLTGVTNFPAVTSGTHFLVRASSSSTTGTPNNSQNKEIQGLASIVSDSGTLHGINPATYPFWKSYKKTAAGAIADSVFRDALDGVGFESGVDLEAGTDYALITTRGIVRRYADTLLSVKRFTNADSVKLHGGFTAVLFDEHPLFRDDQCPVGTAYGLSLGDLFWAQESDWEWMEEDGKVLKWESRKDRYIAVLFAYKQLGLTRRNSSFVLQGVTDDVK